MRVVAAGLLLFLLAGCSFPGVADPSPTKVTSSSTPAPTPPAIIDGGPTELANGTAEALPDGSLRYIVAEGDVGGVVCDRFGLSGRQLQYEDERGGVSCFASLFPGDVLNLSKARDGSVPE